MAQAGEHEVLRALTAGWDGDPARGLGAPSRRRPRTSGPQSQANKMLALRTATTSWTSSLAIWNGYGN